jgi:L-amino acid N-acyltransferase YncA
MMSDTAAALDVETVPALRAGSADDVDAFTAMHLRCSAETICRRYHAPVGQLSSRTARALLEPPAGRSAVMTVGEQVVAAGMFCADPLDAEPGHAELGLMVEDAWQRRGLAVRLLRGLATEAADLGVETLICLVQPENDAVLGVIRRAGLRVRGTYADGLAQYRIPVGNLRAGTDPDTDPDTAGRRRTNRPAMADVTSGLVSLLHERRELREVYPPAYLVDQAVRGGA